MANNIIPLDPNNFSSDTYTSADESLITSNIEQNQFDVNTDYVEYFVYDLNNNKIHPQGGDATFSNYSLLDNEIYVDPVVDLENIGIDTGIVNSLYTFYRKWLNSSPQSTYYIKEISSDRTEIRLDSNIIDRAEIIRSVTEFVAYRKIDETFPDFYINLGSNLLFIANNIKLDTDNTVLIKLYEPLPSNIEVKTSLWVIEKVSEGIAYRVEFEDVQEFRPQYESLSGPNLNLPVKAQLNNSSEPLSLSDLSSPSSQSEYQINSYFEDPSISINIDYTDFSNFINFSSAQNRLENFWYKLGVIQSASAELDTLNNVFNNPYISESKATLNNIINDTITTFDSYEYYLYFESSSVSYPKSNSTPPYKNVPTSSVAAIAWSESIFTEAEDYDRENQNWLKYGAPEFIRDDSSNNQYMTFLNMIGHFVDNNIWVYIKDTTNKWNADNRIDAGISKDLVGQVLRDLGVKLYQNNYSTGDLYSSFLGFTPSGSLFPYPNMTGSLPTPEGYEYVSNFISSSDDVIALDDINKRIYKRIYHNLPYLLKSKGTVEGLRTLINVYGIPDTILNISEFGGKDRINTNDWDLWKHQYNYAFSGRGADYITTKWEVNSDWGTEFSPNPNSIQFRFNAGLAENAPASQSLWSLNDGTQVKLVLEYDTTLPITSGSYSGSIIDPEYQYATLKFTTDDFSTFASVSLPFYNNNWWSVQINRTERNNWELLAGNKIYSGSDGSKIGFIASSSITGGNDTAWEASTVSWFGSENGAGIPGYDNFEGKYQEIRYFNQAISQSVFKDYVMNPQSTEGNGVNDSYDQLIFRAPLGGELYTGSVSVHPKVSGAYLTSSFTPDSNFTVNGRFIENKEWVFLDSPAVGIKNRNTDKIKQQDLILPSGNTLSNLESIQQKSYTTQDYTNNLNLLEVAFSPQNQINDDIISQIGHFNIGDYIGDPRLISSSINTYPSLVELSKTYFDKYSSNYDVYDYIRLIKFFDNSLFKMVKDFVPARTGVATGIVVKQHILERQKYPTPQAEWIRPEYTGSIGSTPSTDSEGARIYIPSTAYESIPIETVSGSDGGSILTSNVTQSWNGSHITPSGSILFTQDDEREFINGEFSGSVILAEDGELNPDNTLKKPNTTPLFYDINLGYFQGQPIGPGGIPSPSAGELLWYGEVLPARGFSFPVAINYIEINEIDKNGTSIENTLESLSEGTSITFRAKAKFEDVGFPPTQTTLSKTFNSIEISSVQGVGGGAWRIFFKNEQILGSLSFNAINTITQTSITDFQVIIDPQIIGGFTYSDDNALLNNATEITPSTIYYDLDYSQGSITPVNFNTIISGSATKAPIQDYNYFARRSIIPRYSGSKNGNTTEYSVTGASIDLTQVYFAYFNWVGGSSPEWGNNIIDKSVLSLRYLIDINGDVIEPTKDQREINLNILRQNFEDTEQVILDFDDETGVTVNFPNLPGEQTVFKSGYDIQPVLYTQTASFDGNGNVTTFGYTGSISFTAGNDLLDNGAVATEDYRFNAQPNSQQAVVPGGVFDFENISYEGANADYTTSGPNQGAYFPTSDPTPGTTDYTLNIQANLRFTNANNSGTVSIEKSTDGGANWSTVNQITINVQYNTSYSLSSGPLTNVNANDLFRIIVDNLNSLDPADVFDLKTTSEFIVTQSPIPVSSDVNRFWLVNAGDRSIITADNTSNGNDLGLNRVYNLGKRQIDIDNSGFNPIVHNWTFHPEDVLERRYQIRFEGTETLSFTIMNVKINSSGILELQLDKEIPNGVDTDFFLLRKYVDNPSRIILDVDKAKGGTSGGFVKPKYLSPEIEDNFDKIVQKLKTDQLI